MYDSSSDYKRVQPFEYLDEGLNEYSFEYSRDILSDLSKFNAPIFTQKKREKRGVIFNEKLISLKEKEDKKGFYQALPSIKDNEVDLSIFNSNKDIIRDSIRKPLIDKSFINNNILIYKELSGIDIFKILFGTKYCNIKILQGIVTVEQHVKKSYIADMYFGYKFIYVNILDNYMAKKHDNIMNVYENILVQLPVFKLNIYDICNIYKHNGCMNIFKNYSGEKDSVLEYYAPIYISQKVPYPYVVNFFNENIMTGKTFNLNVYDNLLLKKRIENKMNIYKLLNATKTKRMNSNKNIVVKRIPETFNGNIFNNIILKTNIKKAYKFDILNIHRKLSNKKIIMSNGLKIFRKNLLKGFVNNKHLFGTLNRKAYLHKKHYFNTKNIKIGSYIDLINQWGKKNSKMTDLKKVELILIKSKKDFLIEVYNKTLNKNKRNFIINNKFLSLQKEAHSFDVANQTDFIYKAQKSLELEPKEEFVFRKNKNFGVLITESDLFKKGKNVILNKTEVNIFKKRKNFNIKDYKQLFYKDSKSFVIKDTDISLERLVYGIRIDKTLKNLIVLPYGLMLDDNSIGFVTDKKSICATDDLTGLTKKIKDLFVDEINESLTKNIVSATLDDSNLWLFKKPHNTWIETHAIMLTTLVKHIMIQHDDYFLEKNAKNSIINLATSVYKNQKLLQSFDDLFINKEQKKVYIPEELSVFKKHKNIYINKNYFANKVIKKAFISDAVNLTKNIKMFNIDFMLEMNKEVYELQVNKENIWYSKSKKSKKGEIFNQYFIEKSSKEIMHQDNEFASKKENGLRLSDSVFIDRVTYESNAIIQEIQRMQKLIKELEKPVTNKYNWAWVYEPDNPLEDSEDYKGLDELLLPEKDVDYSTFEKYIFNKDKMRPTNPIEIIDDTTFIAKYPIKHPVPNYEEVGIVYIDVPSELMYRIFCKYYEIWYANIFKFGNMSMAESLRLMLDFMYSWIILEYTGTQYLEPALRVFRQIRWFGEKSVMHNAKYLISYERTNLVCDLYKGSLTEIENDIQENNTFYVNGSLGVIINNSTYFMQEAYINLYTNYPVETILKFNISQAGGATQVYLDSTYVDNITKASKAVVVTIPPGKHTIKILRPAQKNFATCYIGGIVVVNGSYTNLQITYDPDLKLGNLPLNDVAKKMLDLASLYDNEQEAFEKYREGNLAVGELYKELERYWELHHQGKIKGKRLTIKET
jgi:hypothetical protein